MQGKPRNYKGAIEALLYKKQAFSKKEIFEELEVSELMRTDANFSYYLKNIRIVAKEKGYSIKSCSKDMYEFVPLKSVNETPKNVIEKPKTVKETQKMPKYDVREVTNDLGKPEEIKLGGDETPKVDILELRDILEQLKNDAEKLEIFNNVILKPMGWKAVMKLDLVKV